MSNDPTTTTAPDGTDRAISWVALGLLIGLTIFCLVAFSEGKSNAEAEDKANQLIAALEKAGARAPSQDQIVRVLGDDGGAICEDPGSSLRRAILHGQLTNGASGPGMRPVIADNRVVRGQLLIIEIYCPEELDDFRDTVDDLELDDVVKG